MFRFQGVSLPGFGLAVVLAVLFGVGRYFIDAFARVRWWRAGLVLFGIWIATDIASAISIARSKRK